MTRILLLRHAAVDRPPGIALGHTDAPLAPAGAAAADALAQAWDAPVPARILSSDLTRAIDTARPIAARFGLALATDPRWRELSFGAWEDRAFDALPKRALAAWGRRWTRRGPPGGESFAALRRRVGAALADAVRGLDPDASVLVVAHAGAIRAALVDALGLPARHAFRLPCDHLHLAVIERGARRCAVRMINQPPPR